MDFENEQITILYGSQTGNAQDVAERIWRESKRFFFRSRVMPMDDYEILNIPTEKCIIFVCSTTGQGDEPDNMKNFWKLLLRKNLTANALSHIRYAVFGLGDSSYAKFNFVAKRLNKRLELLGARCLLPLGLGDDQHDLGYDGAADPWVKLLWENVLIVHPLPSHIKPLNNIVIQPRWFVTSTSIFNGQALPQQSIYNGVQREREFTVTVLDKVRTTSENHFQDVRLIKFQTNGEKYLPGDVVVIRPKNSTKQIDLFQKVLHSNGVDISPNSVFTIKEKQQELPVPDILHSQVTFQKLCEEYFDLSAIPRRYTFNVLAELTDSELEREKCLEFVTAEGQDDLYNYCNRPRRNIVEVLQDFPNATKNIREDVLFELLPAIKPRDFSIASSFHVHQNEVHILVAVVKYKTKLIKERLGLCSNYLANLTKDDQISVWFNKGSFKFPTQKVPVIMIGPGTGMAPFRNYIYDCVANGSADSSQLLLFFGCRNRSEDFHCREDLEELHNSNKLNLICAFSRDQENKVYVQHKIVENAKVVWECLKNNQAYIFVAGNSKNMPQQVRESFVTVCCSEGQMSKDEAENLISKMERLGRYQTETWS